METDLHRVIRSQELSDDQYVDGSISSLKLCQTDLIFDVQLSILPLVRLLRYQDVTIPL